MRLLTSSDISSRQLREYIGEPFPPYAILSHTWGSDEVTLQELASPSVYTAEKKGLEKIQKCRSPAHTRDALEYAWYAGAQVCYVYLEDLPPGNDDDLKRCMPECKWFKRGWTLQELIAPRNVIFFDHDWNVRGSKTGLSELLCEITKIPIELLLHQTTLSHYAVARRMSWAVGRKTTRIEDLAYCLLGIFDVNLSLIYGEGMKAFYRLQEAILLATSDLSLFLWTDRDPDRVFAPIFAKSPDHFDGCQTAHTVLEDTVYRELTITTRGIQLEGKLVSVPDHEDDAYRTIFDPTCAINDIAVGICIRKVGGGRYARYRPGELIDFDQDRKSAHGWAARCRMPIEPLVLATKLPDSFPLGPSPVLGNRHCAVKITWTGSEPEFFLNRFRPYPRSHWDMHDQAFFCSNGYSKSWCGFFAHATLNLTGTTCVPVNFFIWCQNWSLRRPKVVVVGLHDTEPSTAALLEAQLDRVRFEHNLQAESLVFSVFGGSIPHQTLSADDRVLKARAILNTETVRLEQVTVLPQKSRVHMRMQGLGDAVAVKVTVELEEQSNPNLCVNPMWRLSIGCKVLDSAD